MGRRVNATRELYGLNVEWRGWFDTGAFVGAIQWIFNCRVPEMLRKDSSGPTMSRGSKVG